MTFGTPTAYSDTIAGTSFALVAHQEAYHVSQPIFVEFWFRTNNPGRHWFVTPDDVRYTILDSHDVPLKITQPPTVRLDGGPQHRSAGVLNGSSMTDNLARLYRFVPGKYTVTASVSLEDSKGAILTAPPITIQIQG
jgi:hypothetical protein